MLFQDQSWNNMHYKIGYIVLKKSHSSIFFIHLTRNIWKGKGAGLCSNIKSEDLSSHLTFYPLVTGPVYSCAISTPLRAYNPASISANWTYRTHCHLCPTGYSFSPESSEAFKGEVSCPRTQHRNYVPRFRGEKHDMSLKILHQARFETARQAATSAKQHALNHRAMYCSNIIVYLIQHLRRSASLTKATNINPSLCGSTLIKLNNMSVTFSKWRPVTGWQITRRHGETLKCQNDRRLWSPWITELSHCRAKPKGSICLLYK